MDNAILMAAHDLYWSSVNVAGIGLATAAAVLLLVYFVIPLLATSKHARWLAAGLLIANEIRGLAVVGAFLGWLR